jgi:hypothetical protein
LGNGEQSAAPAFLSSRTDLPWAPSPGASRAAGDTRNYPFENNWAQQFPLLDGAPIGTQPFNAALGFTPPLQTPPLAKPTAFPFLLPAAFSSADSDRPAPQSFLQKLAPVDWTASPSTLGSAGDYSFRPADPTSWRQIELAQNRPRINPEDIFDPLAPVRAELYTAARSDLQRLQPSNYALSVPSFRRPGGAPTVDEIGELKYAFRVAQSTQPLADTASRVSGVLDSIAQNHRVVAVLQTSEGTFIAGSGARGLTREQRDAIMVEGATQVPMAGEGVHAEIAALKFAETRGKPQFIAASQPFCATGCREAIQKAGGLITSPTAAVFPLNVPSVTFPAR